MPATAPSPDIQRIRERIGGKQAVRETLPGGGVLQIDRGLPYLLVHRQRAGEEDTGTPRLISGEASYLLAADGQEEKAAALAAAIAGAGADRYGAFLVLEIFASADPDSRRFVLHGPEGPAPETMQAMRAGLQSLAALLPDLEVEVRSGDDRHPAGMPPLVTIRDSWKSGILLLGLEVPPIHRDPFTGEVYPRFLRRLQAALSPVLRQAIYEFIRVQTDCKVASHRALGTRSLPASVWEIDRELADIERSFKLLLLVSPVNEGQAWQRFRSEGYRTDPVFHYRLLPVDPDLLKRRLFAVRVEEIDDPAIASLFQDKRQELDRQISMLDERNTVAFRFSSMRLYGTVDERLLAVARDLLAAVPPPQRPSPGASRPRVDATAFLAEARAEFARYAAVDEAILSRTIEIRPDLVGLMVSQGNLMIGHGIALDPARVSPLIHHEIGTHVLTWVNGSGQPLEQLALGLADYDELQEGLAVLSEYLVGGLDRARMRLLAARVIAAHSVEQGASFTETFALLTRTHGFSPGSAWHVVTRVHQSGGFTRDLIYLRGLLQLLDHLAGGAALEPLYLGKLALKHVPIVEELRDRGVLRAPRLLPRFLDEPAARERLEAVRGGITLTELVCPENG